MSKSSDYEIVLFEKQRKENVAQEFNKKRQSLESEFRKFDEEWETEMRLIRQKYMLRHIKKLNVYEEECKALKKTITNKQISVQSNLSANSKLKEIEAKHLRLLEEQQKKQLEAKQKQLLAERNEIEAIFTQCLQSSLTIEIDNKNDQILHTIKHELQTMNAILQNIDLILNKHELSDVDLKNVQNLKQEVHSLHGQIMTNIMAVKQNKQEPAPKAIDQRKDEHKVIEVITPAVKSAIPVVQSIDIIREYLKLQKMSNDFEDSFKRFTTDNSFKQRKNDLQLFVKTTINTISSESVEHIRDKLNRLTQLFSERAVEYSGRQIKCSHNDGSLAFCMSLTSKMFIVSVICSLPYRTKYI